MMLAAIAILACASCAQAPDSSEALPAASCTVTDGDTIRCGDERIRLTAIDAPELGACRGREGRVCVEGDGAAARDALAAMVRGAELTIVRLGSDRYRRTLGVIYADGVNVACALLASGHAEYVQRWDNRRAVARDCPDQAR